MPLLLALLGLQIGYFSRVQPYGRWRFAALAAEALIVYGPLLVFQGAWVGLPGFLGGSLLLTLRPAVGAVAWAVSVVAVIVLNQASERPLDTWYLVVSTILTSLVVFGLTRLAQLVVVVEGMQAELARFEVARERLRIAQDLHDLLGSSLSAITLRAQVGRAHLRAPGGVDLSGADAEWQSVIRLSQQALADVRQVSAGPLRASLMEEIRNAATLLTAAGVATEVHVGVEVAAIPSAVEPTVAAALREGVTNVLRHGSGQTCDIRLEAANGRVVLEIDNDVKQPSDSSKHEPGLAASLDGAVHGQGLPNLADRVAALGGALRAHYGEDGSWRLHAQVPLSPTHTDAPGGVTLPTRSERT
jgi:two-component system sensor histidine kinase DesK